MRSKAERRFNIDDDSFYGPEPSKSGSNFVPTRENLIQSLNWYSALRSVKELRPHFDKYVQQNFPKHAAHIKSLDDNLIPITVCSIAKMMLAGCEFTPEEKTYLQNKIKALSEIQIVAPVVVSSEVANQIIVDTDVMLDQFYCRNYKKTTLDYYQYLTSNEAKPAELRTALAYYETLMEEVRTSQDMKKSAQTNYIDVLQTIISDSEKYLSNSRKERKITNKPRKKKFKSASQITAKVQFKISDPTLKLTSVEPSGIVGASSVWLFNTKYKKMTYLVVVDGQTLSIKGTTIFGFDPAKSISKIIRKPERVVVDLLNMGRISMLKSFLSLKTKNLEANGRINKDMLILKVGK